MVTPEGSRPPDDEGRVLPFRPRGTAQGWGRRAPVSQEDDLPVSDLREFEHSEPEDDYRHRMTVNALGLLVTIVLVVAGIWLADKIAETRATQDCFLSGRRNCASIDVPRSQHF
jgi:hypothetical protein